MGKHALAPDGRPRLQFYPANDTVPVALRLVRHGVRVLSHADILNAVVHFDAQHVLGAKFYIRCEVELMWYRE